MSVFVGVRFYPVEAAVLYYYASLFDSDTRRVARGMLKRGVAVDRALDLKMVGALLSKIPEFVDQPQLKKEAKADLEILASSRAGRASSAPSQTIAHREHSQDPLSGADCTFTVTALEFVLLTYYAQREQCTREQVLRRFLRKYVLDDANFDLRRFRRFVTTDIAPQLDAARRARLDDEMKVFFLPGLRRDSTPATAP